MKLKRPIPLNAKRAVIGVFGTLAGLGLLLFSWIWVAPCALGGCAPLDELAEYQAEGSELLDIDGQAFATLATVNRRIVSLDSLPEYLPQAVVAIEDRRFYDHGGVDLFRTAGALVSNVRAGGVAEGGSTITQQLARNLFPDWLPYQDRNVRRKIMEARVARQIERSFSKDKILELYLNHIYLGSGAYGIDAAAQTYFGKPASELTLMEAATLAGLPQAPSQANPKEDVERATRRRDLVLDQMVDAGYIDQAQAEEAKAEAITVVEDSNDEPTGPMGSYFVERVRQELEETVGSRFYTAGLQIHTTLDATVQASAEQELNRQLAALESGRFGAFRHSTYAQAEEGAAETEYLQGAVVVMDVATGEVRALVGGRDFADSKFNRATQALRQPGSAFKPFIYASALERFRTPSHPVEDSPLRLTLAGGQVWEPKNYTGTYDGPITMREALARSKNTATVRLAQEVGLGSAIQIAHDLGISSEIPDNPAAALGTAEVRPIELVGAYAAFANGGRRVEPHLIRKVVDRNGRTLWEARVEQAQVLDPAVAFVLTTMLQDVVSLGTGTAVRAVGFGGAAAGKTGTTNDASDVWYVGYTPELVAGIWMGFDDPKTIVRGASGGTLAAPVWGRMMNTIYANRPAPGSWQEPSGVTTALVDRVTGSAVSEFCPPQGPTYTEYFIRSSPRQQACASQYELQPRYTYSDTSWIDEEWSSFEYEYPISGAEEVSGVEWPELEALRRRMEIQQRTGGALPQDPAALGTPLPGAAPRSRVPQAAPTRPAAGQPAAIPQPAPGPADPAGAQTPAPSAPPAQTPAPAPEQAPTDEPSDEPAPPTVLGDPVGR